MKQGPSAMMSMWVQETRWSHKQKDQWATDPGQVEPVIFGIFFSFKRKMKEDIFVLHSCSYF